MSEQETTTEYSCYGCGTTTTNTEDWFEYSEHWYCSDCYRICDRCNDFTGDDYYYIGDIGESWCDSCRDSRANFCDSCEEYTTESTSNAYDSDRYYCESCANNNWNWCSECDQYWIDECGCDGSMVRDLNDYSYKPDDPTFSGTDPHNLFFGVEVEAEIWSHDIDGATRGVSSMFDLFYLKQDGSIGKDSNHNYITDDDGRIIRGFEIVSQPYSFEHWHSPSLAIFDYIEKIRTNYKARSWDAKSSCGLHIHLSRAGFSGGAHTHRFLALIYTNSIEMSKVGGRKGSNFAKFSDVWKFDDYGRPYRSYRDKVHYQPWTSTDRYSAVNTNNEHTIELRWFRGTLSRSGILASIQLAHAGVEYTRYLTVANVREGALRWDKFSGYILENRDKYPDVASKIDRLSAINLDKLPVLQA